MVLKPMQKCYRNMASELIWDREQTNKIGNN